MKIELFMDSEFTGLHQHTTLISLGIVAATGQTFYAEFTDYDKDQVDDWLQKNVLDNLIHKAPSSGENDFLMDARYPSVEEKKHFVSLPRQTGKTRAMTNIMINDYLASRAYSVSMRGNTERIKVELLKWLGPFSVFDVHIVSDCMSYDWVLFNQIFGHAFNLPDFINYIPTDICTMFRDRGIDPDISREEFISDMGDKSNKVLTGNKHNALYDAEVIKLCFTKLEEISPYG